MNVITLILLCAAVAVPPALADTRDQLIYPIRGALGVDFFIVNHVDHDPDSGSIRDYACGLQTYDGHQGTDFVLRSFRQMDSGVSVVAAASGIVTAVVDTFPDRNKVSVPARGFGNYVAIQHEDGFVTYYAHNRRYSATVRVGDTVNAGQEIALVGSSGNSEDPHVHFELWQVVDPFKGACVDEHVEWRNPSPYQTSLRVIDTDITTWTPSLDTLRERPPGATVVTSADSSVTLWSLLQGVRATDRFRVEWYTPDNVSWFTYEADAGIHSNYFYWWSWIDRPTINGTWTSVLFANGVEVARKSFVVSGVVGVPSPKVTGPIVRRHGDVIRLSDARGYRVDVLDLNGRLLQSTTVTAIEEAIILPQHPIMILRCTNGASIFTQMLLGNTDH